MTSFVSLAVLEAEKQKKKEEKRKARDDILKEARHSFEREKERLELKRQRGDDQWIAPGVSSRLDNIVTTSTDDTQTKKEGSKKHKKRKKKGNDGSPGPFGSDEEPMWVELDGNKNVVSQTRVDRPPSPIMKRDDWMLMPMAPSSSSLAILSGKQTAAREEPKVAAKLQCADKPGQHPRELNPYWKDGGVGLPIEESPGESKPSGSKVNAAGRSWMLRAYKRAIEQAETEGRSLDDIATERWGSLDKLYSLLKDADIDPEKPDVSRHSANKEYLYSECHTSERHMTKGRGHHDGEERRGHHGGEERWGHHGGEERRGHHGGEERWGHHGGEERRGHHDREEERRGHNDGEEKRGHHGVEERRSRHGVEEERRGHHGGEEREPRGRHSEGAKVQGSFMKPGEGGPDGLKGSAGRDVTTRAPSWRKDSRKGRDEEGGGHCHQKGAEQQLQNCIPLAKSEPEIPIHGEDAEEEIAALVTEMVDQEPVTDTQLNALSAKILKAEMMDDRDKVEALQGELDLLRAQKALQNSREGRGASVAGERAKEMGKKEENTVVLTRTDRFGNVRPFDPPTSGYRSSQPTHTKRGKRERYFHDDDRHSLRDLLEQERTTTAEDTHAMVARMASKFVPASHLGETVDDLVDSKSAMRSNPGREEERQRQRAVLESRRMTEALENCHFCVAGRGFQKHLLVAMGIGVYLCVPGHESLTEGHCFLVPAEHTACSVVMDENVWSEVKIFQKGLTKMFSDRGMDVVFMETYMSAQSRAHMCIDCVPLPRDAGAMAPMYFKKAILECDEEWAQNRKLVDTQKKGLRGSVPAGLPYFSVDFGLDNGFAHVIEDADKFPRYFGREVVGGMLDVEPRLWLKPPKESFDGQKRKVLQMGEWWKPYDWTQKLRE